MAFTTWDGYSCILYRSNISLNYSWHAEFLGVEIQVHSIKEVNVNGINLLTGHVHSHTVKMKGLF